MKNILITLLVAFMTALSVNAQITTLSGNIDPGDPTYDRTFSAITDPGCMAGNSTAISGSVVFYETFTITPTVAGVYTFTVNLGTLGDSFMALYCAFDPLNGLNDLVAANDDAVGLASGFDVALDCSQTYTLVVSTFASGATGDYTVDIFGPAGASIDGPSCVVIPPVPCASETVSSDLTGDFDPANWVTTPVGDGSVVVGGTTTIDLTSSDDGTAGSTTFCVTVSAATTFTFDWSYVTMDVGGSTWDPFFYSVNGVMTQLSVNGMAAPQSGSETVMLDAGDTFCFDANALDGILGPSVTTISNFTFTECNDEIPVPAMGEWALILLALGFLCLGLVFVTRKKSQLA